jgi:putative membrane protein
MRPSHRILLALAAVLALGVMPSAALAKAGHHSAKRSADAPRPISAQAFLTKAAASNRFEIVTGELAQQRAASDDVKALGAMFVRDHTALLQKGAAVAAQLRITVPEGLTPKQQRTVGQLEQLSGKRFDRAWIAAQIAAHQDALKLTLRGTIRGERPEIRDLAAGALPVVAHHYGQLLDLSEGSGGHGRA